MKIYSVGSRLIFLISLLFMGGQLFAAEPDMAELSDAVQLAKIKLRRANTELSKDQEDSDLQEGFRLAQEELEEAKLALRVAQREANKKKAAKVQKPVEKEKEQEKEKKFLPLNLYQPGQKARKKRLLLKQNQQGYLKNPWIVKR